ncbi:MAG: hypothetical protein AAF600_06740 [Bacteroidota bacterium]
MKQIKSTTRYLVLIFLVALGCGYDEGEAPRATGTLTVNGETFDINFGYYGVQENPFDNNQDYFFNFTNSAIEPDPTGGFRFVERNGNPAYAWGVDDITVEKAEDLSGSFSYTGEEGVPGLFDSMSYLIGEYNNAGDLVIAQPTGTVSLVRGSINIVLFEQSTGNLEITMQGEYDNGDVFSGTFKGIVTELE